MKTPIKRIINASRKRRVVFILSKMDCSCCKNAAESRSMQNCKGCNAYMCQDCFDLHSGYCNDCQQSLELYE